MREHLPKHGMWFLAAVILLAGLTLYTRGAAPWQKVLTNDEMLHLESWRNRYRTDDIYPSFVEKAKIIGLLEGENLERFERAYAASPLFQRGLLVLNDFHPPTFPVLAELLEAVTHSSLVAVRVVSAIASALAVLLAYRLGRGLRDPALGLWVAVLLAIGFLAQVHAGIARPYALTQFALVLALCAFVREEVVRPASPWRFLLAALFVQSTNWPVWAIVFPLVLVVLWRRLRSGGLGSLVRQTWWYALLSIMMLPLVAVLLLRGVAETHMAQRPLSAIWYCYTLAAPFASIDWVLSVAPGAFLSPAAILMLLLVIAGAVCTAGDAAFFTQRQGCGLAVGGVRVGLLLALVVSVGLSIFAIAGHIEAILVLAVVPTVFAAVGLRWLLRTERASWIAAAGTLALFLVIRVGWPEDPRVRALLDTDYASVAERLHAELGPDDIWTAFGRHRADCLYRYGPFPDPVLHLTKQEFRDFLETLPRAESAVLIFARGDVITEHRELRTAPDHWEFMNGYYLVRIPPRRGR